MRVITETELAFHDGIQEDEVWIAYKGLVYNVTRSELFQNGKHYQHKCGCDLTDAMVKAPHLDDLLHHFPIVGSFNGKHEV